MKNKEYKMNFKNLKKLNSILLTVILLTSCVSKKTHNSDRKQKEFSNRSSIPLISDCRDNHTESCLQNTISDLILKEANENNLDLKNDTLKVSVRINPNGSISVLDNKTNNKKLKASSLNTLENMKSIEPAYIESLGEYRAVSYSWYILIKDNKIINRLRD
ncbi:hypothetical protein [uncultured Tenacibaculum sp.]|uniref:hypothetical protein n=1 Tax=uncultured Tenacibaculum sp. TaxID=174713 RepID=UPI00261CF3C7|nr:hypothetical protein [uncultured Tenacibaculum sp.]